MFSRFNVILILILLFPVGLYFFFPDLKYDLLALEISSNRFLSLESFVLIYLVASVGLNVQTGFAGQLNLGYGGFMAIGAYTVAIWQSHFSDFVLAHEWWTLLISLTTSFAAASIIGFLVCLPTLRLRGDYFAIVTFGFAELVRQIIKNEEWLTGGANGIPNISFMPHLTRGLQDLVQENFSGSMQNFDAHMFVKCVFFLCFSAAVICLVTCLRDSPLGRALFALRENEKAAQACGISLTKIKSGAFLISAGLGGVAGYMYVILTSIASPDDFTFIMSVFVLCCVVLGGLGSIRGSVVGALILMSLGEFLRDILAALPRTEEGLPLVPAEARIIFFGLVLVLMMRFRPNGLISLESDTRRLADAREDKKTKEQDPSPYYRVGTSR
jgi:branched-chain amino acid transport system permease protein